MSESETLLRMTAGMLAKPRGIEAVRISAGWRIVLRGLTRPDGAREQRPAERSQHPVEGRIFFANALGFEIAGQQLLELLGQVGPLFLRLCRLPPRQQRTGRNGSGSLRFVFDRFGIEVPDLFVPLSVWMRVTSQHVAGDIG